MFSKVFKPLTLSFLLTVLCVAVAIWTTPTGFAGDNEKCDGTVYETGKQKCSAYGQSDCSDSTGYRNRDDNYKCVSATGKKCEIFQKSGAYKNNEYPCYWDNGSCKEGDRESSGGLVNSCNTTDMSS